jgi:hypothetical protein
LIDDRFICTVRARTTKITRTPEAADDRIVRVNQQAKSFRCMD